MKFLTDFFPIVLFFIAYKLWGIYTATAVAMGAGALIVCWEWVFFRKIDKMQLATVGLIGVLGGATLFFHNDLFIKWKPTLINWLFSVVFLVSHYFGKQPLIKRMMSAQINLPEEIWNRLNMSWAGFFLLSGVMNLYVAYYFSTNAWVNFKLFGLLGLTFLFVILQAVYLSRYAKIKI